MIELIILIWLVLYVTILSLVIKSENEMFDESTEISVDCRFCEGTLTKILDFGEVALAGGFLRLDQFKSEKKHLLRFCYCSSCHAVQLADRVYPDAMFRKYFYFSSATETMRQHFREYADEVVYRFRPSTAIEIGCNDGVLLEPLRIAGVKVTGVDPSTTVPTGPDIINEYFTEEVAERIGKVDLVIANNVFAHIDEIQNVTNAIVKSMKDDGVFIMEAHYLGDMIEKLQYDWIYHEHLYYYSLISLENHLRRYGLIVFDVKPVKSHGGSMRYYICHTGNRPESYNVTNLRSSEERMGLNRIATFKKFAKRVNRHRTLLRSTLSALKGKVAGYGASGRANALIQYCGLKVDYIVDDAPAKHGVFTPGSHIEISSRDRLVSEPPDHVIAFAWTFADEIIKKCSLPMIVPLPKIHNLRGRLDKGKVKSSPPLLGQAGSSEQSL